MTAGSMHRRAAFHDARVNLAAHPMLWPLARLARRAGGVQRVPGLGLVVSDALLAHDILSRDRDFVKNGRGTIAAVMTQAFGPDALANMDGESHRQLRQRLGVLADPALAESWLRASVQPIDEAFAALSCGQPVDLARVASTFSGRLTLTLLGVAPTLESAALDEAAREVHALGARLASSLQLVPLSGTRLTQVRADHERLVAIARDAFASTDLAPGSLVSRLKALECSEPQVRGILSIFFVAGALTLGVAVPRIVALLADSGELPRLQEDVALVNSAVDEGMRFVCPVPATMRVAAQDVQVGRHRVTRGTRVIVLTANSARDRALFPDPDRFDVARVHDPRSRYLWYGAGPHFCLGFALAQRSMRHVVRRLAALHGRLVVTARTPARGVLLPAWSTLRLRLETE